MRKVRHDFKLAGIWRAACRLTANKRRVVCARVCVRKDSTRGFVLCWQQQAKRKKNENEKCGANIFLFFCLAQTLTPNILKGVSASICCLRVFMWLNVHKLVFFLNGGGQNRLTALTKKKKKKRCVCERSSKQLEDCRCESAFHQLHC